MSKTTGWERRLVVAAEGRGLVGHAGAVLLRRCADKTGLTSGLSAVLARRGLSPGWDRGVVLVQLAVAITLGATAMADIALLGHQACVFGAVPSDATVRRALDELDDKARVRIARARAAVRAHVWCLLAGGEGGFPWVHVAGKILTGWILVDIDGTLITARSKKQGAAATFKKGFGHHPLGSWVANTAECLVMKLREGSAGSNTAADHIEVVDACLAQIPRGFRRRVLFRVDGAGASHALIEHLIALNTTRRTVKFVCGWSTLDADEAAIAALPDRAWTLAVDVQGEPTDGRAGAPLAHVAELTGLAVRLEHWPAGVRLIVRRSKPSRRHERKLTAFEQRTGWRYQILATNIDKLADVPASHHPFFLDVLYRQRGGAAEQAVRTGKAMGLGNLPSKTWNVNLGWIIAANIANDLHAYTRLLGLTQHPDLAVATPDTLRFRLWHLPARLAVHAHKRVLKIPAHWPWARAFTDCWTCLAALPDPG